MDIKLFTYFLVLPVINFYGFGESAPATTNVNSTRSRSYLKCMFCNDVDTADSCIEEISCAPGQYCFLDKYSEITFADGKEINIYKYNAGCRSTAICHIAQCKEKESGFSYNGSNHTARVRTKRQMIRPVHCSECCTKDRCNLDLCDFKSTGSDATRCYSCQDSLDPTTCTETVFCQDDEMCLLIEEIRINPDQSVSTVFQQRCERKELCKAVHANNILETNETTTKTAPSTTTTTTALPSTTRPTLVEFTPPVKKRLLRSRRSHNLIQLKAECCQGDLCNAFNLHDPNLYKDREAFVDRDHHLISLPDNYECPTTTTKSINFTMPMTTTTTTTTTEPTTPQSTSTPTTEMTTMEPTTQPETTETTASMKQTTSTPSLTTTPTTTTMPTTTTKPTTTTTTPTTNMPKTTMPTTDTPTKITMPTTTTTTMPITTPTTTTTTPTTTTTTPTITTTTPTTTTTMPTTTTTTPTTTTTTPTTTTTTPTTTTTTPTTTTTAPKPPTSCNLCNGMPIYICEEYFTPMKCDTSEQQYCLNILVNNKDGSRTLDRKCATEKECKSQWWDQTSDRQECSGYDPNRYVAEYFSCTFCCSSSLCNQNIVPDNLYVPQS